MAEPQAAAVAPRSAIQRGWVQLAVLVLVGSAWGSVYSLIRIAVTSGVPPLGYSVWAFATSGVLMTALAAARRRRSWPSRRHVAFGATAGLFRIAAPNVTLFFVLQHVPAGLGAMVIATGTVMTYVFALAIRRERFRLLRVLGILLGLGGVALIFLPRGALPETGQLPWVALLFLAPFFYSTSNLFIDTSRPSDLDGVPLIAIMFLSATVPVMALAAAADQLYLPSLPPLAGEWPMFAHGVITALAFVGALALIRAAGAVFASQASYVISISGVFWGVVILGERHSVWVWGAFVLIIAGVGLVNLGRGGAVTRGRRP